MLDQLARFHSASYALMKVAGLQKFRSEHPDFFPVSWIADDPKSDGFLDVCIALSYGPVQEVAGVCAEQALR